MCALYFLADGIFPERENSGYVIRLGLLKLYLLYVFIFYLSVRTGEADASVLPGTGDTPGSQEYLTLALWPHVVHRLQKDT